MDTPGYAKTQQSGQPSGSPLDDENWAGEGFVKPAVPETEQVIDEAA